MKLPLFILLATSLQAAEPLTLKLWPEGVPGKMLPHSKATADFIRTKAGKSTITDITDPTMEVYRPEKPNGNSVIVAPGGAYIFLSAVHEGTQVCEWLNTLGVTGILLKYRTPTRDEAAPHEKPVQDAAKAIALVREHAKEWNLDPNRVGLLGFSAGGNLLAHIACDRTAKTDLPNFGIMIYGGGFLDPQDPTKLKADFTVPADAPPMFLACAHDDGQNPVAATLLYLEYKKLNIPCEIHLFTKGGHGFGMRDNKQPINAWPQRCAEWLGSMGKFMNVEALNKEIALRQEKIEGIAKMIRSFGDDLPIMQSELESLDRRLKDAKAKQNAALEHELQDRMAEIKRAMKEIEKQLEAFPKPESIAEDITRLKKEKLELESERDRLLQSQPKPKSP